MVDVHVNVKKESLSSRIKGYSKIYSPQSVDRKKILKQLALRVNNHSVQKTCEFQMVLIICTAQNANYNNVTSYL